VLDLHSHILPGIDDGAQGPEDSLAIARAAVAHGIDLLAATPHVRDDYPTPVETMEAAVATLRSSLLLADIPLNIRGGGEIAVEWLERLPEKALRRFGLAGNPDYLLVEFPHYGIASTLLGHIETLRVRGVTVVLAHPERNRDVHDRPELLRPLVEAGALVQVTSAAIVGGLGRRSQEAAQALLDLEFCHFLASDVHDASFGWLDTEAALGSLGSEDLLSWLTRASPAAIVEGKPLPSRPRLS
jgi:protein-tyrosine phosphatase